MGIGLFFCFSAVTTYPFVESGLVHDPFVHAAKSAVIKKGFCRCERSRVGVPQGGQFLWKTINCPAAVADDACSPMAFLRVMDALPFMGAI